MNPIFEWEKPLIELEQRLGEMRSFAKTQNLDVSEELARLEQKADELSKEIYAGLTPWQKVQIARHSKRPTFLDHVHAIFDGFTEMKGDRVYRDDQAIVGGIARIDGQPVTVIGPQKGRDTKENLTRNFGLPHPEGYRKALRLMQQAEKFGRPIVCLIDVVGAYPGIEAEQRGQGLIIAESIQKMSFLKVPILCAITGEGGSGGALAIGIGDRILMMEHAWYSVISPEMCANILWRDSSKAEDAAGLLKLTAADLLRFQLIDDVVPEPLGGAHRQPSAASSQLKEFIGRYLHEIKKIPIEDLLAKRLERFRKIGEVRQVQARVMTSDEN